MEGLNRQIVRAIRMRNIYEAQLRSLQLGQPEHALPSEPMKELGQKVEAVDIWLSLLPAAQAFVIRWHLVDRLSWESVQSEYNAKWGVTNARSKRTLVRYQSLGIRQIEQFVTEHYVHFENALK